MLGETPLSFNHCLRFVRELVTQWQNVFTLRVLQKLKCLKFMQRQMQAYPDLFLSMVTNGLSPGCI